MKKTIKLITTLLLLASFVLAMPVMAFAADKEEPAKAFFMPCQIRAQRYEAFKEHIEEEKAKFAQMNEEQLTSYIDERVAYAKALEEIDPDFSELSPIGQLIRLNLKLACLAAAQLAKLVGLPCTGILIEYSVFDKDYEETDGLFAWKIKRSDAYENYNAGPLEFKLEDDIDLFFSIHGVNGTTSTRDRIRDTYNFDQMNFTGIAAILNEVGAVMQEYQVLEEIEVTINISGN